MEPQVAIEYDNLPRLLEALRSSIKMSESTNEAVSFSGAYTCPLGDISDENAHSCTVASQVWKVTGYHFRYVAHKD